MSEFMTREDFEGIEDREFAEVETRWNGKKVRLRSLTAQEASECEEFVYKRIQEEKPSNLGLCYLGQMLCDGEGKPLFKSIAEGEKVLNQRNPKQIKALLDVARKITPMSAADYRELESEVSEQAKNLETLPGDSSTA